MTRCLERGKMEVDPSAGLYGGAFVVAKPHKGCLRLLKVRRKCRIHQIEPVEVVSCGYRKHTHPCTCLSAKYVEFHHTPIHAHIRDHIRTPTFDADATAVPIACSVSMWGLTAARNALNLVYKGGGGTAEGVVSIIYHS